MEKDIYTTKDIARILGVDTRTITAAIRAGHLTADKFGTSYVIRKEDLEKYLEYRKARGNGKR